MYTWMRTHLGRSAVGRYDEFNIVLGQDPLEESEKGLRGWGSWGIACVSGCWGARQVAMELVEARQPGHQVIRRRGRERAHTGTAEGINDLVCLLLVIEIPSLFEGT